MRIGKPPCATTQFFRDQPQDATFSLSRKPLLPASTEQENDMPDSVYKVIELVGTSSESWEKAASNAVEQAAKTLRDLRVAEIVELDMQLDAKGKVEAYRAKVNISFKFEGS
jgi:flavin-binding protein dodecin